MAEIENFDVGAQNFARQVVIQLLVRVVAFLEQAANRNANVFKVTLSLRCRSQRETAERNGDGGGGKGETKLHAQKKRFLIVADCRPKRNNTGLNSSGR